MKIIQKFKEASPTIQGMIVLGILLAIGIIIRWRYIFDEIASGFKYFSK